MIFTVYMAKPEKLLQYLKDMGYDKQQIEYFAMFIEPTLTQLINNLYVTTFTPLELEAMQEVSEENEYDVFETDEYVAFCYKKKTGKDVDDEVVKFLDEIIESLELHFKTISNIVDKLKDRSEEEFVKEFEEYMKELEQIYIERMQQDISKKTLNQKDNE